MRARIARLALAALAPPLALAACTEVAPVAPDAALPARQEAACAAAIAAHIGAPLSAVSVRRASEAGGIATVEARDGDRLHLCRVDGAGQVLGFTHPGSEAG